MRIIFGISWRYAQKAPRGGKNDGLNIEIWFQILCIYIW